jgi:hypothetical protein
MPGIALATARHALMALALVGLLHPGASRAQTAPAAARQACGADFQRYCAAVAPGGGRVRRCLEENRERLSPACRATLDQATGRRPQGGGR